MPIVLDGVPEEGKRRGKKTFFTVDVMGVGRRPCVSLPRHFEQDTGVKDDRTALQQSIQLRRRILPYPRF
ncbi:hypothetical protein GWI33_022959 [Rhynchophorus ferrugineus]|uniref:Uncharacterized protein n=1 Tax=Rhynchophorus ferrugineus TaxID=354439 RepID=A0A834HN72_RHYFE|nr:hypothetical protein GWI33_022961 [Rhynchophorus ferrugineus]KAF7264609.1 hypothetical protein GWI33_022959 [Rhynchophorus ferrugineus]